MESPHARPHASPTEARLGRRAALGRLAAGALAAGLPGCGGRATAGNDWGRLEAVWGVHGVVGGRVHKPRAIAVDRAGLVYLVDFTARILVYTADGEFVRSWTTPEHANGRPTGLTIDPTRDALLVADTHYYRVLSYTLDGRPEPQRTIGGECGPRPGQFEFVTDVVRDTQGCFYVGEYGANERIQKFSPDGEFLLEWGAPGDQPGQFKRPQSLAFDRGGTLWVADSCNHRLQAFAPDGALVACWGREGSGRGELYYPYGIAIDDAGDFYVAEYGNHRVQKFSPAGESLGVWGRRGRSEGELWDPWSVALLPDGRLLVLDSANHRVQRVAV